MNHALSLIFVITSVNIEAIILLKLSSMALYRTRHYTEHDIIPNKNLISLLTEISCVTVFTFNFGV